MSQAAMQVTCHQAIEAYAEVAAKADRVAHELDKYPEGAPLVEIHDDDSLVVSIDQARGAKDDVQSTIAVARTRSQEIALAAADTHAADVIADGTPKPPVR